MSKETNNGGKRVSHSGKKARTTEIQDSLIDRYVEQEVAIQEGNRSRAVALQFEIKELLREREHIKRFAAD